MRRVRPALLALATLLLVLAASWLALGAQARRLGEALVRDAATLEARRGMLSSARERGSVLGCFAREHEAAPRLSGELWGDGSPGREVAAGRLARASLGEDLEAEVALDTPWFSRVLACGHLDEVTATRGLGPFRGGAPSPQRPVLEALFALKGLGPLALRAWLDASQPDEALAACGALLVTNAALTRVMGPPVVSSASVLAEALEAPCAEALAAASPSARAHFAQVTADVRRLLPRSDELLAHARVAQQLELFTAWLPEDLAPGLPEAGRADLGRARRERFERGLARALALRLSWHRFDRSLREIEAAARLPRFLDRARVMADAERGLWRPELLLQPRPVEGDYFLMAARAEALLAIVERLSPAPQ